MSAVSIFNRARYLFQGPDYITYFRNDNMEDEIKRDKRITWVVEFYAAWSPACVSFAPIFAKMSADYNLDNLKFGKVDVTRNSQLAEKFRVDHTSWSKQLPTVIMFQNGKESMRRPAIDLKNRPIGKFAFTKENVVNAFQLNDVYYQCKKNPIRKKKDLNAAAADDEKKDNYIVCVLVQRNLFVLFVLSESKQRMVVYMYAVYMFVHKKAEFALCEVSLWSEFVS